MVKCLLRSAARIAGSMDRQGGLNGCVVRASKLCLIARGPIAARWGQMRFGVSVTGAR